MILGRKSPSGRNVPDFSPLKPHFFAIRSLFFVCAAPPAPSAFSFVFRAFLTASGPAAPSFFATPPSACRFSVLLPSFLGLFYAGTGHKSRNLKMRPTIPSIFPAPSLSSFMFMCCISCSFAKILISARASRLNTCSYSSTTGYHYHLIPNVAGMIPSAVL